MYYYGEGIKSNISQADKLLHLAADQNHIKAIQFLKKIENDKDEVKKEDLPAYEFVQEQVYEDYGENKYRMGINYSLGNGVEQNIEKSIKYLTEAAESGHLKAQLKLASMYEKGNVIEKNITLAANMYELAAKQGHPIAQHNLGVMYINANGVVKNYKEAYQWFKKSAEQGYAKSQYNLGLLYYYGIGTSKNNENAYFWLILSSANGYVESKEVLPFIESLLSKRQIEEIQAKAKKVFEEM